MPYLNAARPGLPATNALCGRVFRQSAAFRAAAGLKRACSRTLRACRIGDAPDGAARVLGDQQCPVLVDGHADRAAPDLRIVDHEAGGEILVFAGRRAVLHDHADDLVAGAFGAVPGAVFGGENVAAVLRRELRRVIERHAERGRMGLDEHVRDGDLVLEIRPLAAMTRVLVGADVVPGPAVERAFAHAGDVIGRHVVAEPVALVGRAPHRAA